MFYCSRFCHFKTVTESCEGALSPPALQWTQSQLWLRKTTAAAAARVAFMLILLRALILLSVMKAVLFQFYSNSLTKKWNVLDLGVFIFAFPQSPAAFPVCKGGSGRSGGTGGMLSAQTDEPLLGDKGCQIGRNRIETDVARLREYNIFNELA